VTSEPARFRQSAVRAAAVVETSNKHLGEPFRRSRASDDTTRQDFSAI